MNLERKTRITPPLRHSATPPLRHSATPPLCHSATLPLWHAATSRRYHSATRQGLYICTDDTVHCVYNCTILMQLNTTTLPLLIAEGRPPSSKPNPTGPPTVYLQLDIRSIRPDTVKCSASKGWGRGCEKAC